MYEPSLRMPLVARWPGVIKPGSINTDLVQNLDFAETFLDLAGAKIPQDMQGRSIVPLLKGQTPSDWRKSIYYHYYEFFTDRNAPHAVRRHYGVHRTPQTDPLLQRRRMGTVRSSKRPARTTQRLHRSRQCQPRQ